MSREEIAVIASLVLLGKANKKQRRLFLEYVEAMENLLTDLDEEDAFGTEGWKQYIGIE